MNRYYDANNGEFATAIAAATFAIYSREEASSQNQKKVREGFKTPSTRVKSRKEESFRLPKDKAVEASMRKRSLDDKTPSSLRQYGSSTRQRSIESTADAWEKAEMAKIQKRCEKMNHSILAWENEKKMRAKRQMEMQKSELEQKKTRIIQHYESKLGRIDHVAGGARAQVEEKRKIEAVKVKERAKKIRSSGKVPVCCFCF